MMWWWAALLAVACGQPPAAVDLITVVARHREVFRLHLNASLLSNSSDVRPSDELRFSTSLRDGPDLPSWLSCAVDARHHSGLVYGVPPHHVQQLRLEVIVTNVRSYQTSRRELLVLVEPDYESARHEVQMKINNMNPVDLFSNSRLERLGEIYEQILWPAAAGRLHLSWLAAAAAGAPSPPLPLQPAGLLLRLASSAPFSSQLRDLQQEVRPLWARVPCPRDYKRSSTERHFRQRGFHVDWCQFKLFQSGELSVAVDHAETSSAPPPPAEPLPDVVALPTRAATPARGYTLDFLATICLPLVVALLLCGALTCIMCCQGDHLETDSDGVFFDNVFSVFVRRRPTEIQMVQYAGGSEQGTLRSQAGTLRSQAGTLHSQAGTLRRAALRDVSPRLAEQQPERERRTPHRDRSPPLSGATTPDSGGFNQRQLQPPPYTASPGRRS